MFTWSEPILGLTQAYYRVSRYYLYHSFMFYNVLLAPKTYTPKTYRELQNQINHTRNNHVRTIANVVSRAAEGSQLDRYGFLTDNALALTSPDTINNVKHSENCRRDWLLAAPSCRFMNLNKVSTPSFPFFLRC